MKRDAPREFIRFDKGTPLAAFVGAIAYAAENKGDDVSFTIGPDVQITPEGSTEPQSLSGQRAIISSRDLNILNDNMVPAAMGMSKGVLHPHHQITRDEALQIKNDFDIALGYVLAKLDLNDDVWHLIKDTPKVSGFLGAGGNKPVPISDREAQRIISQVQEGIDRPRPSVVYDIGEEVKVTEGPFASFNGIVEEIDEEKSKLKVSVSIFGRATPVELEYSQVEKI